jgi:predicted dehydrogenase
MTRRLTRREMLQGSAALTAAPLFLGQDAPAEKLRIACIGVGGRGGAHFDEALKGGRIVALVDVDDNTLAGAMKKATAKGHAPKPYSDFRKMYDEVGKDLDAVFVATPDHNHAAAAMRAIRLGKHVYVEKPMCHDLAEVRALTEAAREKKVVTQLGNQGHSGEGYRRLVEYIQSGAIGAVTETHTWMWCTWNFGYGADTGRPDPKPAPKHLHWDEWIGTAPMRDYHDGLHPVAWRGWRDFGTGNLGDFGCHMLDGAVWALKPGHASTVTALESVGGSDERFPRYEVIRWEFPAREGLAPFRMYWYGGGEKNTNPDLKDQRGRMKPWTSRRPWMVEELEQQYGIDLGYMGTLYVGEKGLLYTGASGSNFMSIPEAKLKEIPEPPKTLRRIAGSHQGEFLRACKGGEPANCNFDYAGPMNEIISLGHVALRMPPGKKLEWDGPAMRFRNAPEADRHLRREYRQGWEMA